MKKPHLEDYGLTPASLERGRRRRLALHLVTVPVALAVAAGNYTLWLAAHRVIGAWSLLGLFLTFWGLIPAVLSYVLLDGFLGKYFYPGLQQWEGATKRYEHWFAKTQIAFWDALSGRQFEREVAALLNRAGYSATLTPASGDGGVDVLLSDGTLVQCKAHRARVAPAVARELYGTLQHRRAPRAILISKNGFSKGVRDFVHGKNIELWDVHALIAIQMTLDH